MTTEKNIYRIKVESGIASYINSLIFSTNPLNHFLMGMSDLKINTKNSLSKDYQINYVTYCRDLFIGYFSQWTKEKSKDVEWLKDPFKLVFIINDSNNPLTPALLNDTQKLLNTIEKRFGWKTSTKIYEAEFINYKKKNVPKVIAVETHPKKWVSNSVMLSLYIFLIRSCIMGTIKGKDLSEINKLDDFRSYVKKAIHDAKINKDGALEVRPSPIGLTNCVRYPLQERDKVTLLYWPIIEQVLFKHKFIVPTMCSFTKNSSTCGIQAIANAIISKHRALSNTSYRGDLKNKITKYGIEIVD